MRSGLLQAANRGMLASRQNLATSRKISTSCAVAALTLLTSCGIAESWNSNSFSSRRLDTTLLRVSCSPSYIDNFSRPMSSFPSSDKMFEVAQFPCRSDNYGFLIHDPSTGATAAIDTPSASAYKEELDKRGWELTHILNTHRHHDHVGE